MSHTRGEWTFRKIEPLGKHKGAFTVKATFMADYSKISQKPLRTTKFLSHFDLNDSEGEANARLIAAAPDLLNAAKLFIAYDSGCEDAESDVAVMLAYAKAKEAIVAAIAKATQS
jgi:hypothetical protein